MQEYFEIGQIVNTHGLKGYVRVNPFTDDMERFLEIKCLYVAFKNELIEFKVEDVRIAKTTVNLKLEGIDDINQAEKYKGCYLKIARKDAKKLEKNTYFIADLIGLDVYSENNQLLGKLDDIFKTGSNDVYVIKSEDGKQILLPAISQAIKSINLDNGIIIVDVSYVV
ncbi:MAG: 16S rRNA processing protein RimM [Clostridia bacterium]|nr:16S rRNA processing protein RimM [Clostridia bacterium]